MLVDRESVREKEQRVYKTERGYGGKQTVLDRFITDFAAELDIFSSETPFPNWIFDFREGQIRKIAPELRKICKTLKDCGLDFKIKWPMEIGGQWKFADIYFPKQRTVLMLTNEMALIGRPHWMLSDRAAFFSGEFRVVEVESHRQLVNRMKLKAQKAV